MKTTKEHYAFMKSEILKIDSERAKNHFANLQLDERVKDIEKRFRWDCFYVAGLTSFACNTLYSYLNDTHIDSALKSIMKEVNFLDC